MRIADRLENLRFHHRVEIDVSGEASAGVSAGHVVRAELIEYAVDQGVWIAPRSVMLEFITRARDEIKIFTDDIAELKDLAGIKAHARDTLEVPLSEDILKQKLKELAVQVEIKEVAVQDPPAKLEIHNKHLLEEVVGLDDYTKKYKAYMGSLTTDLNAAMEIEPEVKRTVAEVLNGKAGIKLIAKYGDEPAIVIYAAICLSQNGDPAALDKYHLSEDVKARVAVVGKAFLKENAGGLEMEM